MTTVKSPYFHQTLSAHFYGFLPAARLEGPWRAVSPLPRGALECPGRLLAIGQTLEPAWFGRLDQVTYYLCSRCGDVIELRNRYAVSVPLEQCSVPAERGSHR